MALTQADLFALTPDQIQALTAKGYLTPDLAGQILQQKQALDTQGPSQFDNIQASLTGAQAGIVKPTQITSGNLDTQGPTWKVQTPPPAPPPVPPPQNVPTNKDPAWIAAHTHGASVSSVAPGSSKLDTAPPGGWQSYEDKVNQVPTDQGVARANANLAKGDPDKKSATGTLDAYLNAANAGSGGGGGGSSGPSASQTYRKGILELDKRAVDATQQEQKATSESADIQSGYEAQMAQALDYARQDREAAFLRDQAARQKVNDAMEERDKKIQAEIDAVKDIDPKHWWKEAGVGGSIIAALSMGLGALGSGLSGIHGNATPNYAMQIIDGAINRDMQAQQANLEKQWNKIAKEQGLSKDKYARDQWMLEQQSQDAEKKYNLVLNQLDSLAHQSKSEVVLKNADILNAQIEQRLIAIQQKTQDRMYAVAQEDERKAAAAAASSPAMIAQRKLQEADKAYGEYFKSVTEKGETPQSKQAWMDQYLGGAPVQGAGFGKEGNVDERLHQYDIAIDNMRRALAMVKSGGSLSPSRTAEGKSYVGIGTRMAIVHARGFARYTDTEAKGLDDILPSDPNSFQFTGADQTKLETGIAMLEREKAQLLSGKAAQKDHSVPGAVSQDLED